MSNTRVRENLKSLGEIVLLIAVLGLILLITNACVANPSPVTDEPLTHSLTLSLCQTYILSSVNDMTFTSYDSVSVPACRCFLLYPDKDFALLISGPEPKHNRGYNKDEELAYAEIVHKNSEKVKLLRAWCKG